MKLAFFGGTFDPPHKGHEMIIENCSILFDQLLIVPNCISPDKKNNPLKGEIEKGIQKHLKYLMRTYI